MTDPDTSNVEAAKRVIGEVSAELPAFVDVDGEQVPLEDQPEEVQDQVKEDHGVDGDTEVPSPADPLPGTTNDPVEDTTTTEDEDEFPAEDDGSVDEGDDPGDVNEDEIPAEDLQDPSVHDGDDDAAGDDLAGDDEDDSWLDEQAAETDEDGGTS